MRWGHVTLLVAMAAATHVILNLEAAVMAAAKLLVVNQELVAAAQR